MSDIIKIDDKDEKKFQNEYKQIYYKNASVVKMAAERLKRYSK